MPGLSYIKLSEPVNLGTLVAFIAKVVLVRHSEIAISLKNLKYQLSQILP